MKSIFYIVCFLTVSINLVHSQENGDLIQEKSNNLPVENIFTHINSGLLFVGDHLYYKIYCVDANSLKATSLSNIAYLKLYSSEREIVYSNVIDLKNGLGYGDYLLPISLKTGNYKLVVYTNWMLNNEKLNFFEQDILIINPYSNQKLLTSNRVLSQASTNKEYNIKDANIYLNKTKFSNREKVECSLDNLVEGSYSVAVRILDSIDHPFLKTSKLFQANSYNGAIASFKNVDALRMPELGGKLIKGKIESSNDAKSLNNISVFLSIPGDDFFINITNTDNKGNFYFVVDKSVTNKAALIDVFKDQNGFTISLDELDDLPDKKIGDFSNFGVLPKFKNEILKRSIYNQIENSYFTLKPDTIFNEQKLDFFEGVDKVEFLLDDYTRFNTVQETFTEIVQFARIRKEEDGKYNFQVLGFPPYDDFNFGVLTIIDGILVDIPDNFITNFDANRIEKIQIIRNKYYLSTLVFNGIVIIETKDSDFFNTLDKNSLKIVNLDTGNSKKSYYKQTHMEDSKLPDFRTQLLWDPNLVLDQNNSFDFYTSDVDGEFEISIQGFTKEGEPVSLYNTFTVE